MKLSQRFKISYEYDVFFTKNLFHQENFLLKEVLGENAKIMIFIDSGVVNKSPVILDEISNWLRTYSDIKLLGSLEVIVGGERIKNDLNYLFSLTNKMLEAKVCRHSYVLAIGGGAVLDAVGFVTSIFHRGVRHIRIPTTTLSQADSGVGVKNGINFFEKKNLLGCFAPPIAVLNDFLFLKNLAYRDALSGLAEAFKVAIVKDKQFYQFLKESANDIKKMNLKVVEDLVQRCAIIHHQHIGNADDPFERTNSRPLDYGHWLAHRLEMISENGLRHGEAVAVGLVMDNYCAVELGLLEKAIADDIYDTLKKSGFTMYYKMMDRKDAEGKLQILAGLEEFREHLGGELTLIMLTEIGKVITVNDLPDEIVNTALKTLKEKAQF